MCAWWTGTAASTPGAKCRTRSFMVPALLVLAVLACAEAKSKSKCVSWRQTGGCDPDGLREPEGDRGCDDVVPKGASGFCECENERRAGYVTCDHAPMSCTRICNKKDWLGYLEDTIWFWNGWREVEFRSGGDFIAPEPNCEQSGRCSWKVDESGRSVTIDWGAAGLHTVKLSRNRKELSGTRFDGDPCSAEFRRRDVAAGEKRHAEARKESGAADDDDEEDLYAILGVDPDAEMGQIKKAFRRMSRKYHPDKTRGDPSAADMFEKVRNAYEVVGDEDKRILYDTGGIEAVREAEKEDASGGQAVDPFSMLFGGGQQQQGRKAKKGPDAHVELSVSLEDMYNGGSVEAAISRRIVCRGCKNGGKGRNREKCRKCGRCPNEVRTVMRSMGPGFQVQQQEEVPSKHRCRDESTTLKAVIEKGMDSGAEIKFERMSEQRPGQIPGDIIVVVRQKPHDRFRRDGNDLHVEMDITLREALLGFRKSITHLDGHEVVIDTGSQITRPFQVRRYEDEGMPHHEVPSNFGAMHVKFNVVFPPSLTEEQKRFVEQHL